MNTILLSGYDKKMAPIGELTIPFMDGYARIHGIAFKYFLTLSGDHPAYWEKVPFILDTFKAGYDRIIWLDADQFITNPSLRPWKNLTAGFHASTDWGKDATHASHFSMCGFVVCRDAMPLFEWLELAKDEWVDKPFPEQAPMRYLYLKRDHEPFFRDKEDIIMDVHPRSAFNSVPIQVHESVVEPWNPLDWCCHITMVDVPRRVEIFHEIEKQCTDAMIGRLTGPPSASSTKSG